MSRPLNRIALVDTSFWFAAFTENGRRFNVTQFNDAQAKLEQLMKLKFFIPWPILYETVNSEFVEDPLRIRKF